jgi:putative transposase
MKKLNKGKLKWILREMEKGELSVWQIAKQQKVTPQWVRWLYKKYLETGEPPFPKPSGRKPKPIPAEERQLVLDLRKEHPVSAVNLEKILDERGTHIPHNKIHRILREEGLAKEEPKKSNRRKWVRYERKHSNSLWHADWFDHEGKQVVLFEDDASRFIPSFGVFPNANSKNAAKTLEKGVKKYNPPKQLVTDHGTQFTSLPRERCSDPGPNEFQKCLEKYRIKHIKARVKHPQTNGKVERLFQTLRRYKKHFGSWEKTVEYYNFRRPHASLENGKLRTPYQAFLDKTRKAKNS